MVHNFDSRRFSQESELSLKRGPSVDYRSHALGICEIGPNRRFSGSPAYLKVTNPRAPTSLVELAAEKVRKFSSAFARPDCHELEFTADPTVHRTSVGGQIVHLHQHCQGVPVFEAVRSVHFDPMGNLVDIVGDNVPVPFGLDLTPELAAGPAVAQAAQHVSRDRKAAKPTKTPARVLATFPLPSRPTVLKKARIAGEIRAHLTLFYRRTDVLLSWLIALQGPDEIEHNVVIGARGQHLGEVLYCSCTTDFAHARALVFRTNPGEGKRVSVDMPLALSDLPPLPRRPLPAGFPPDWVESNRTRGNNTSSHVGNKKSLKGSKVDGVVTFSMDEDQGLEQGAVNIFYFCNYLHDFFYILGFDENEQNFQVVNFSGVAGAGDELIVRNFPQRLAREASISKRSDGTSLEMKLGLMGPKQKPLPAALDADVVFHEFTHGVTNRMVGGRLNFDPLRHEQSHALAEGFSDYFALTIQNFSRASADERTTIGQWLAGSAAGFRQDPYDEDFPSHFGDLGSSKMIGAEKRHYQDPHDAGEIWCATLVSMHRRFGEVLGSRQEGHRFGWQLVVNSLKLMPTGPDSPSFLDARDALFRALDELVVEGAVTQAVGGALRAAMLATFLKFGMGPAAISPGATYDGIVADLGP